MPNKLLDKLKLVAPGTKLRKALDDIVMANFGALIVLADDIDGNKSIQGGFRLDTAFSPEKLYELAKMDGAIILSEDLSRIFAANAHLLPDTSIPTTETGIRHRTAERFAVQSGKMVIIVSERNKTVAVYYKKRKHQILDFSFLNAKTSQALVTLEKYRYNFDKKIKQLNTEELIGRTHLRDIVDTISKGIDVLRLHEAIVPYVIELGVEGRLAAMQLKEITDGVGELLTIFVMDYTRENLGEKESLKIIENIKGLKDPGPLVIARTLGREFSNIAQLEECMLKTRGYRLLKYVVRIPMGIAHGVVRAFKHISVIGPDDIEALRKVEGIGEKRAQAILTSLNSWRVR